MKKVMYFGAAVAAFPCDAVIGYELVSEGVTIWCNIPNSEPAVANGNVRANAIVTCAAGEAGKVLEELYDEINYGQSTVVDVLALKSVLAVTSAVIDLTEGS